MAGNANSGRKRVLIPKGKEAEEELRRLRRQERRRERRARKKAEELGIEYVPGDESTTEESAPLPAEEFKGLPSLEETKAMFGQAFSELGGVAGLVAWGRRYPKEFYAIWARICLPKDGGSSGDNGDSGGLEAMLATLDKRNQETVN